MLPDDPVAAVHVVLLPGVVLACEVDHVVVPVEALKDLGDPVDHRVPVDQDVDRGYVVKGMVLDFGTVVP